jgi:hypothetical protein
MTPAAFVPDSLFVKVRMAPEALRFRLRKYQRGMTLPASDQLMLSYKWHIGCIVIIGVHLWIQLPAIGAVTFVTGDLEIVPVRGIILPGSIYE